MTIGWHFNCILMFAQGGLLLFTTVFLHTSIRNTIDSTHFVSYWFLFLRINPIICVCIYYAERSLFFKWVERLLLATICTKTTRSPYSYFEESYQNIKFSQQMNENRHILHKSRTLRAEYSASRFKIYSKAVKKTIVDAVTLNKLLF